MTLMEVLKNGRWYRNLRIANGWRWMVWDEKMDWGSGKAKGAWVVHSKDDPHNIRILVTTADEELAVRYLLYQEV